MKNSKQIKANANNRAQALKAQQDVRDLAQHMQGMLHRLGMQIATVNALLEHLGCAPQVAEILGKYREAALQMRVEQAQVDAMVDGVGVVDTTAEPA